jgi:hypothetical protein
LIDMDYGSLLNRAWKMIWEHKFLILLGLLVALSSGGNFGSSSGVQWQADRGDLPWERGDLPWDRGGFPFDPGMIPSLPSSFPTIAVPIVLFAVAAALVIGLGVWVVSTIARGGLIAGVGEIDAGGRSSFGEAWRAGWNRGWRLIGIGLVPAIPSLMMLVAGLVAVVWVAGLRTFGATGPAVAVLLPILAAVLCILGPIALVLNLLRVLANRACMLEELGVLGSYRRGTEVLMANLGPAVILVVIQLVVTVGVGLLAAVPGFLAALCCFLWPVLLLLQGAMAAFFSSLWTLAWREWTEVAPAITPAVSE